MGPWYSISFRAAHLLWHTKTPKSLVFRLQIPNFVQIGGKCPSFVALSSALKRSFTLFPYRR